MAKEKGDQATTGTKWRAINGVNYPRPGRPKTGPGHKDEVRHEPGDVFDDISAEIAGQLLDHGDIEPWKERSSVTASPAAAAATDETE